MEYSGPAPEPHQGVGALGSFVGNPEASTYSRSELFSGEALEVVARFSLAGGDPEASDAEKSPRGMALQFRMPDGGLHHMTMIHTPMFFAAVPQTFLDKFIALTVDPATGKPDPEKFQAFKASHRDNDGQAKFLSDNNPPTSYANCAYSGIHTFKFINKKGETTLVKFRFVPRDGEKRLSNAETQSAPRDFLERALSERTKKGPVRWDMILTIGEPGDPEMNPTILWPKTRKEVNAGTLTITSATPSAEAGRGDFSRVPFGAGRWHPVVVRPQKFLALVVPWTARGYPNLFQKLRLRLGPRNLPICADDRRLLVAWARP
jgi:catalase